MRDNSCINCETTTNLNDYWPDDRDRSVLMCDDCMEEQRRVERLANEMAALPSCDYRAMIIDRAETVQQLVNQLRSHDQSCSCAAKRPVQSEGLVPATAGVACGEGDALFRFRA